MARQTETTKATGVFYGVRYTYTNARNEQEPRFVTAKIDKPFPKRNVLITDTIFGFGGGGKKRKRMLIASKINTARA